MVQLSVRPVSGDVSKSLSLHVLGKKEEERREITFFLLVPLKCVCSEGWECICISG